MQSAMSLPMTLPTPVSAGSIEAYIQAVNRIPMLSPETERALALRLRDQDDLDAARELVLSHLRLVVSVARGYLGYGLPHADLIQEGNIGLMKAVKRFDPARNVRLVSFAIHWIKAEIHEYILRNWRLVKVATTKAQRKLFFNLRSMKQGLAPLTAEEVGARCRRPQRQARGSDRDGNPPRRARPRVRSRRQRRRRLRPGALPRRRSGGRAVARAGGQAGGATARRPACMRALAALDARSRRIVEARWLKEKDAATLHDLAAEFKVSAERIRQLEAKALRKDEAGDGTRRL